MNIHWAYAAASALKPLAQQLPEIEGELGRAHILDMIASMEAREMRTMQANRWLGWIQCALVAHKVTNLHDMMEHNRDFKARGCGG